MRKSLALLMLLATTAQAKLTIPYTFTTGTTISSSQLNANFSSTASELNTFENVVSCIMSYGADTGVANAYVVTVPDCSNPLIAGISFQFIVANSNTGPSTIDVNGLGIVNLKQSSGVALSTGQLVAGSIVGVTYDGTEFQVVSGLQFTSANLPDPSPSSLGGVQSFAAIPNAFLTSISPLGVPSAAPIVGANLPYPSPSTLGGVESLGPITGTFLSAISPLGVPSARPIVGSDLPYPSPSTLGGVESLGPIAGTFLSAISPLGVPSARPIVGSDLPNPSPSSLGGIQSFAAVSHEWINTISAAGVPSATQPACGDLSNGVASCSTDTTNATNISSGTLNVSRLPATTVETNQANTYSSGPQSLGAQTLSQQVANASSTGTTLNKLAKLTGAPSTAVITATSDTGGAVGIVVAGAGTTGNADIATSGQASCIFDGATTAGHYVQISSSTGGDCHDAGGTYPSTGQVLGRVLSTNGAGGTFAMTLFPSEIEPSAGTSGVTSIGISVPSGGVFGTSGTNPVTTSGTIGITATGNSGGIPYFSSSSAIASSSALTQYGLVYGGGAGATPVSTAAGTTGQVAMATTSAAPTWATVPGNTSILKAPTVQSFCGSGSSSSTGTYTPPSSPAPLYDFVYIIGAGGGGGGSGTSGGGASAGSTSCISTTGTSSCTGTVYASCTGGGAGGGSGGGAGGGGTCTNTTSSTVVQFANVAGANGLAGANENSGLTYNQGGAGGPSPFGGAMGGPASSSSGGGGQGGNASGSGVSLGAGGGAGGFTKLMITGASLAAMHYIGGGYGAAGGAGSGSGVAGNNGGTGCVIFEEYYQ